MLCYIQIWSVRRMRIRKDSDDSNITGGIIVQWGLCNSGCHPKLRGSSSLRPVAEIGKQRTPKVTPLNSLFLALCFPKICTPRRCTFEEAPDSESQKISADLLIVCWRKRGFIVFAGRANIGHFYLRRRAGL